jgi:hypothetical protein
MLQQDYGFLSNNIQKKELQYEQGIQQLGNEYNAITSQAVTNGDNQKKQQEYISRIQEGLKKVSTQDLSLPQNVAQAERLYEPFWKDTDMLYDISITKDATNKLKRAESDNLSKDEKIRTSYNPWSVARQKYVLEDLKMAKRGDGSIGRVEKAEYLPITDYQAYVDEVDKAQGFKGIHKETPNGPTMIKETNGVGAYPQLQTRYDAILGSKFQAQFSQQGWVEHRQELDALAQKHPDIPRDQLNNELAKSKYQQLIEHYDKQLDRYSNDMFTTYQIPIKSIYDQIQKQGGKQTDEQIQNLQKLEAGQEQYNKRLDQISTEREQFIKANPEEKINAIANNPENYYSTLARQATIDKLASAQATNYTQEIELNKVWDTLATHRENEANIKLRGAELGARKQNALWEHEDRQNRITADLKISGIDPQTGQLIAPQPGTGVNTTHVLGENTTDQQHQQFAEVLNAQKANQLQIVASASFGANGVSKTLKDLPGIDANTLLHYNTQMQRLFSNENYSNKSFSQKPEEKDAFNKVRKALSQFLGRQVEGTYDAVAKAQNEYVAKQLQTMSSDLQHPMTPDNPYMQAYAQSIVAKDAMNGYIGKVKEEQEALKHLTVGDKDRHRILLNDAGTAIAGENDIAQHAPTLEVMDSQNNRRIVTPNEYAKAYLNHSLDQETGKTLILDGKKYTVLSVNGQGNEDHYIEHGIHSGYPATNAILGLMSRFGSYKERDALNTSLQNKVASYMPSVAGQTGKTGLNVAYSFGNEKHVGNGEHMIVEALQPSNMADIRFQGEKGTLSQADQNKLRVLASSPDNIRKELGEPTYSGVSSTGQKVVRFAVKDWDGKGETKIVEIPLSSHVSGELLRSISDDSGLYVYDKILKGGVIENDQNDESMGFRYVVSPDNADHPSNAVIQTWSKIVDPKSGVEKWVPDNDITIPLANATPDQIMIGVSQRRGQSISRLAQQRYQRNSQNAK